MGNAVVTIDGNRVEIGVAILSGGLPVDPTEPGDVGKAIYIIELGTGRILRRFTHYNNDASSPLEAAVSGSVAAFDDFPGSTLTRAFVGDAKGRLLRVDLNSTNPNEWKVSCFHDLYGNSCNEGLSADDEDTAEKRRPIFLRPSISTDNSGRVIAMYGSGDVDRLSDRSGENYVVSLAEKIQVNELGFVQGVTAEVNWSLVLTGGEKLTGAPLIFNSTAYFPTFVPNPTDVCSLGNGRVYAVDFVESNNGGGPVGRFNVNDEQFDGNGDVNLNLTGTAFFDLPADTIVFGLDIVQPPSCTPPVPEPGPGDPPGPPGGGFIPSNNPAPLELVIQTGSGSNAGIPPPGAGSRIRSIKFELERPPSAIFPTSWSSVLD